MTYLRLDMANRKKSSAGYRATGAFLLVLALVVTAGCIGGVDAEEVREDALEAMESADTYDFEMEMDMTMGGDDTPGELSVSMDGEGSVDEAEERMEMFMTTGMLGFLEMNQDVYVVDDTMYMKMDMGDMGGMEDVEGADEEFEEWLKMEGEPMVSEMWNSYSYAEQYQEMLEISEVSYEDDAEVDGEDAYVITLQPDPEEYDELAQEQMGSMDMFDGMGMEEEMDEMEELFGEVTTEEISATYWISQDTNYILRSQSEATVTMPMGMNGDEVTTTMEADIRMFNHGEDVDIQLPDEAENAVPFDEFMMDEAHGSHSVDEDSDHVRESDRHGSDDGAEPDDRVDDGWGVDVPDDVEADEEVDDLIESVEVEVHEFDDAPDTYWVTVHFEEFEGEWLRVESVESGGYNTVDSPGMTDYLGVDVAPEGDEIVVTLAEEDGTVVEQRETYEP